MCLRRKRCIVDLRCVEIKIVGKKSNNDDDVWLDLAAVHLPPH